MPSTLKPKPESFLELYLNIVAPISTSQTRFSLTISRYLSITVSTIISPSDSMTEISLNNCEKS